MLKDEQLRNFTETNFLSDFIDEERARFEQRLLSFDVTDFLRIKDTNPFDLASNGWNKHSRDDTIVQCCECKSKFCLLVLQNELESTQKKETVNYQTYHNHFCSFRHSKGSAVVEVMKSPITIIKSMYDIRKHLDTSLECENRVPTINQFIQTCNLQYSRLYQELPQCSSSVSIYNFVLACAGWTITKANGHDNHFKCAYCLQTYPVDDGSWLFCNPLVSHRNWCIFHSISNEFITDVVNCILQDNDLDKDVLQSCNLLNRCVSSNDYE
ncbi:hypothetical protein GJ496_002105 [Pomphorhynchus laevis]|nr:hypothetical protein GJ496_002105 [Pomphorhynchus laevis]